MNRPEQYFLNSSIIAPHLTDIIFIIYQKDNRPFRFAIRFHRACGLLIESGCATIRIYKAFEKDFFRNLLEDIRMLTYTSLRNTMSMVQAVFYFVSVELGKKLKLNILLKKVYAKAKRFFDISDFKMKAGNLYS